MFYYYVYTYSRFGNNSDCCTERYEIVVYCLDSLRKILFCIICRKASLHVVCQEGFVLFCFLFNIKLNINN